MSDLSAAKRLVKEKNWSADDLAQIIGYVMMGETPAYIADRLFVCELDVREVLQQSLLALPLHTFHDQARKSGFGTRRPIRQPSAKPENNQCPQPWKKRRFCKVRHPQVFKARDLTAEHFGDPPFKRSALNRKPEPAVPPVNFKTLLNSIAITPTPKKENTHAC